MLTYGNKRNLDFIPEKQVNGSRRFRINFEAIVHNGSHLLIFAFVDNLTGEPLDRVKGKVEVEINQNIWEKFELVFKVPSGKDSQLNILCVRSSDPSILKIRNLMVIENIG